MALFVTGGTGFIGRHLLARLSQDHPDETIYSLVRGNAPAPLEAKNIVHLRGDSTNLEAFARELNQARLIFHLGGRASLGQGDGYRADNVEFLRKLIALVTASPHLRRFVFTSSIAAVDRAPADSCAQPLTETSVPHPLTDYGRSKLECERLLEKSSLDYVILRPALVYGPGMRVDSHLRFFLRSVMQGKLFTRFFFPGEVSVLHVRDLVEALILAAEAPAARRQLYFAAHPQPVALGEIFRQMGELMGRSAGRFELPLFLKGLMQKCRAWLPLRAQNLFSPVLVASPARLMELGFQPRVSFAEGLLELCREHSQVSPSAAGKIIVTGAASGIGLAMARALYARGHSLLLIDRQTEALTLLGRQLHSEILVLDLNDAAAVQAAADQLLGRADEFSVLINNAGVGYRGLFLDQSLTASLATMQINCLAPLVLIHGLACGWRRASRPGQVVNIASSAAWQPLPYMSVYAASKAWMAHFSEGLAQELADDRMNVLTVYPSGTATHFQAGGGVKDQDRTRLLRPEFVANCILWHVPHGKGILAIGSTSLGMNIFARVLPRTLNARLWKMLMGKLR